MKDNNIKQKNINFWTVNVPGVENQVSRDMAGTLEFYKKVDQVRYQQEPYLNGLFAKILKKGLVSLEVGFGLGSDLRTFAREGLKVTGLDYSPENAYLSKTGLRAFKCDGTVVSGDAEFLPFPKESFDLVYSWGCLHHTPDTQKAVNELFRVLRPAGKAVVMLYHKGYQYWYMLACYVFGLKWLKVGLQSYINSKYDQTPLSRIYSRRQLYKMFKEFSGVSIRVVTFGGIQSHPVLKYVWKIFNKWPWLMERFGSFAIITAAKPGQSQPAGQSPCLCCPLCYSKLDSQSSLIRCLNPKCSAEFVYYKDEIPMFHLNSSQALDSWLNKNK